jgi:hypothetical protein
MSTIKVTTRHKYTPEVTQQPSKSRGILIVKRGTLSATPTPQAPVIAVRKTDRDIREEWLNDHQSAINEAHAMFNRVFGNLEVI